MSNEKLFELRALIHRRAGVREELAEFLIASDLPATAKCEFLIGLLSETAAESRFVDAVIAERRK
jgi:hypothetical protein